MGSAVSGSLLRVDRLTSVAADERHTFPREGRLLTAVVRLMRPRRSLLNGRSLDGQSR